MAFNPALYNLISFTGLTEAFAPDGTWLVAIQSPNSDTINYVKASDLIALITGTNNLPDGIISGIDQTVNNLTDPKVLSVSTGQWRIANVAYNNNAIANFNIPTAHSTLDRIDRIYLYTSGVNYQVGTAGSGIPSIPLGAIGLIPFTVPAGGGDITEPSPTLSAQYAVMNSLNTGDFDITGQFKVNGLPFISGSSALTFDLTGAFVTDGAVSLAGLTDVDGKPMPSTGTKNSALTCFIDDDTDNSKSVSFTPSTQAVFGGFSGDETKITIIITF